MSLQLKAFPHGRPHLAARPVHRIVRARFLVPAVAGALLVVLLPLAGVAEARTGPGHHRAHHQVHKKQVHKKQVHKKQAHKKQAHKKQAPRRAVGRPPRGYVVAPTSYFSFPLGRKRDRVAIRKRVLLSINSTWGGRRTRIGTPLRTNGSIRIATWSFDDWDIARALVAARKRGVSVQVVAAKGANKEHAAWRWLTRHLGTRLYRPGRRTTREMYSFARGCKGACRGPGGTAHAKYFLFDNVGPSHARKITFQTSMNLTTKAFRGQWNQAQVLRSPGVYDDYLAVFRQTRIGRPTRRPYRVTTHGQAVDYFFPRPKATRSQDPVMQILNGVTCRGATTGTSRGRTKIRVTQYAIYGDRGVWIAKKLRLLWKAGCDIAIIYSISSRPVLGILRSHTGRGPIPMRQSVVKDPWGNIVKYNHSKWMAIAGHWGGSRGAYATFNGSANWADLAFGDDEQMQRLTNRHETRRHLAIFARTWREKSSGHPAYGRVVSFGRTLAAVPDGRDVPADEPAFGHGVFRYMTPD